MGSAEIESIVDPFDARLDDYRNVKDAEWIQRRDIFLAEGRLVVERLLASARFRVRSVLVTETALRGLRDALDPRLKR